MARAVEITRPLIDSKHHELKISVPETGLLMDGDPMRLSQVFANLLNNAAKYTNPGGDITVEGSQEDQDVVLRVRDNGRGIPPDHLAAIFDLFVQGEQPLDRAQGGLGVGLTLVRRLVQLHGGRVDASSAGDGRGSEFSVRLPALVRVPERATTASSTQRKEPHRVHRILVVDDNVDAANTLAEALRLAGHEVREEHEGGSALAALKEFRADVILLDLGLPGMDGYEVARRVRADPDSQRRALSRLPDMDRTMIASALRTWASTGTW